MKNQKKSHSKLTRKNQQYEDYWFVTLGVSDWGGEKFNTYLQIIVNFIDEIQNLKTDMSKEQHDELENRIQTYNPINKISIRKVINQFLKTGFINNGLRNYHKKTRNFLEESNEENKRIIYSEILYDNASFNRTYTKDSKINELKFLIKTLEKNEYITKNQLLAIMCTNIEEYKKGYLTKSELKRLVIKYIEKLKIVERKYNQQIYLWGLCRKVLLGITYDRQSKTVQIEKDDTNYRIENKKRDPYKQLLYKHKLCKESKKLNSNKILCYYDQYKHPYLIASHIKLYSKCQESEQFDVHNGLLLAKHIDILFDKGWITFDDNGAIICADTIDDNLKDSLLNKSLDTKYLTEERKKYMAYHKAYIFNNKKHIDISKAHQ